MNPKFRQQSQQLYRALKQRGQTWSRSHETTESWAYEFRELAVNIDDRKIQKVLNWYCKYGCGALFVPLLGTGETFREKFHDIDECRRRLRNQTLRYYDDLLDYKLPAGHGSRVQRERQQVSAKMQQRITFATDLKAGRVKLPEIRATLREPGTVKLTKAERRWLKQTLLIDRDYMVRLFLDRPGIDMELARFLDRKGIFKKLRRYCKRAS